MGICKILHILHNHPITAVVSTFGDGDGGMLMLGWGLCLTYSSAVRRSRIVAVSSVWPG